MHDMISILLRMGHWLITREESLEWALDLKYAFLALEVILHHLKTEARGK